ncbi:OmpA family protein [Desulfospira joergensenii]|uniref:OmpA family protein n=1 Tax=Desulfospira joergensenii TaxID=53329 RepID=UPI0003B57604|nr:OmpA family protein [Desulfospira joergensenii]
MEKKPPEIDSKPNGNDALETLKDLLIQPEKARIQKIETRLDDPMVRAREISQTLPEAISLSVLAGGKLARVIQPVIDNSIKSSVGKNPKALADAIFPALGPGIRKAISSTIMGMIQSLNQALNHSFSIQGLKWRFEALKTGKPFGEIVLLHTLLFRVEQIFLIHKKSGIVLEHVVAGEALVQDPDLVSAMLTAIQDFIKDSFTPGEEDEELDTLRMGSDRSVWIEQGEQALLAAVIRGTPPMALRIKYRELLEEIHLKAGNTLSEFDGDPFPFAVFREPLKQGLDSQEKSHDKKVSPLLWVTALVLISAMGFIGFNLYKSHLAWQGYLTRLKTQKGIILLSAQKRFGRYQIQGFKDPLVQVLPDFPENQGFFSREVRALWTPFYSLDPEFVIQRAKNRLKPPQTVKLSLSESRLIVRGEASQEWIETLRQSAAALPGIDSYDDSLLINPEKIQFQQASKKLESEKIYFRTNSTRLVDGQEDVFQRLAEIIGRIQVLQARLKIPFRIMILGHTDSSGTEKRNQKLSRDRAEKVFSHLLINGVNPSLMSISGVGDKIPLREEISREDRQLNRAVTFRGFSMPKGNKND